MFKLFLKNIFFKYIEDIFIFCGLGLIIVTTFFVSKIAGLYLLGFILIGLGLYFSRNPP